MRKWDEKTFLLQSKPLGEKGTEKKITVLEKYMNYSYSLKITNVNSLISLQFKSQFSSDQTVLADKMGIFLSPRDNLQNVHTSFSTAIYSIW